MTSLLENIDLVETWLEDINESNTYVYFPEHVGDALLEVINAARQYDDINLESLARKKCAPYFT